MTGSADWGSASSRTFDGSASWDQEPFGTRTTETITTETIIVEESVDSFPSATGTWGGMQEFETTIGGSSESSRTISGSMSGSRDS